MKDAKIKTYTIDELRQQIVNEQEMLRKMKFAHKISTIENPAKIKTTRRLIAQLKTALRAKEMQQHDTDTEK